MAPATPSAVAAVAPWPSWRPLCHSALSVRCREPRCRTGERLARTFVCCAKPEAISRQDSSIGNNHRDPKYLVNTPTPEDSSYCDSMCTACAAQTGSQAGPCASAGPPFAFNRLHTKLRANQLRRYNRHTEKTVLCQAGRRYSVMVRFAAKFAEGICRKVEAPGFASSENVIEDQ